MIKRILLLLVMVALTVMVSASVSAGTAQFSGTIDSSDPQMDVVTIDTPDCLNQVALLVHYETAMITVDTTGSYNLRLNLLSGDSSFYVYANSFDPTNGAANCQNASNTNLGGYKEVNTNLVAGTTYIVVVIDDALSQPGAGYNMVIDGPGNITVGAATAVACPYPLPSGSNQRNVPLGAPAYYDADLGTRVNFDLPAGNWWVTETSGDFVRVWIACQASPVWIPVTALG